MQTFEALPPGFDYEVQHGRKTLAGHRTQRTRTSREEGATDTRSQATQAASRDHGRKAWGPGSSGPPDSRRDDAPDSRPRGEDVSAAETGHATPLLQVIQINYAVHSRLLFRRLLPSFMLSSHFSTLAGSVHREESGRRSRSHSHRANPRPCNVSPNGLLLVANSQRSHYRLLLVVETSASFCIQQCALRVRGETIVLQTKKLARVRHLKLILRVASEATTIQDTWRSPAEKRHLSPILPIAGRQVGKGPNVTVL